MEMAEKASGAGRNSMVLDRTGISVQVALKIEAGAEWRQKRRTRNPSLNLQGGFNNMEASDRAEW